MKKPQKNIIAYVMNLPEGALSAIRRYEREKGQKFRVMLIRDTGVHGVSADAPSKADIIISVDFAKRNAIAEALAPYQDQIKAITCRSESNISRFIEVIPHVPYLRTPTTESLMWSTDKLEMRRRFAILAKQYSPKYTIARENTKGERKRIIEKIGFPLVVKPTNLAQSLLVSICYHEEELKRALMTLKRKIKKTYKENKRSEEPRIIVEEFMDGDMYSVDAYVNSRGVVYFCPMVKVITGRNIGHDDFYNYLRITPTRLKQSSIEKAHKASRAGIHALGLRNSTAHIELMKIDDDWKIIEIGPRIGGFRDKLHRLSCDIDHTMNDILIRFPQKPVLPKKCKGFAATLMWYPKKEGKLVGLRGIKRSMAVKSFVDITVNKKLGDVCKFAKNGGKSVFTITLFNQDRSKLLADIRRLEQVVSIETA